MSIMPGAVWRPITIPGGNPGTRTKGRAIVLHVAASEATSLWGFFNNNANANSHFYVAKDGTIEQYVDTDLQAWASMAANKNTISVETQGGVVNADAEPWTPAQVESLARICAWAHTTEGTPLALMPNSLPGSRGIGYHRLGIDPWRVAGGEVWSGSRGKLCPGAAKIAQIPQVIARAQQLITPSTGGFLMALSDAQQVEVYNNLRLVTTQMCGQTFLADGQWGWPTADGKKTTLVDMLRGLFPSKAAAPVNVDPAALAAALLADEASVAKLGDAIAAGLAKRVGNG